MLNAKHIVYLFICLFIVDYHHGPGKRRLPHSRESTFRQKQVTYNTYISFFIKEMANIEQ